MYRYVYNASILPQRRRAAKLHGIGKEGERYILVENERNATLSLYSGALYEMTFRRDRDVAGEN